MFESQAKKMSNFLKLHRLQNFQSSDAKDKQGEKFGVQCEALCVLELLFKAGAWPVLVRAD